MQPTSVIARVQEALDTGVPADPEQLRSYLGISLPEVERALAAVQSYGQALADERARRAESSPIDLLPTRIPPGTTIGDFVIEAVIGEGSMGTVYRASQSSLGGREVALKVLRRDLADVDARYVARFRREAELASQIHHPGLAEVYGAATSGHTLCFAMRLVGGPNLRELIVRASESDDWEHKRRREASLTQIATIAWKVADAAGSIHAQNLVHRDIKPANIILEPEDSAEDPILGNPVLVDFGLLRSQEATDLTGKDTCLGTPAYSSKEARTGAPPTARDDVYALGATLYDLLAMTVPPARPPHDLPPIRTMNPAVPPRLAAIVGMALEERPELRYRDGWDLRDDLRRYLDGGTVRALPANSIVRCTRWVRRHPIRAARAASLTLLLAAALVTATIFARWAWTTTRLAHAAADHEERGELVAAARCYRELYRDPWLDWLWWLNDANQRRKLYLRAVPFAGSFTAAVTLLEQADRSGSERRRQDLIRRAHGALCSSLFDPDLARVHRGIHQFLLREVRLAASEIRLQHALDTWTNYLSPQNGPQIYPQGLSQALLSIVDDPAFSQRPEDVRASAIAAFGSIHRWDHFERLAAWSGAGEPPGTIQVAENCSCRIFYRVSRSDQERSLVTPEGIVAWLRAAQEKRARLGPRFVSNAARHAADWEARTGTRLPLSASLRARVDATTADPRKLWSEFDTSIWTWPSELVDDAIATPPPGAAGTDLPEGRLWFVPRPPASEANVKGTVTGATLRGGEPKPADNPFWGPFACLNRPGVSRLRVTSFVPPAATALRIHVQQEAGTRPMLRDHGRVEFEMHLEGLPWSYSAIALNHVKYGRESGSTERPKTESLPVQLHVFGGQREITLSIEYVSGTTTYRIYGVEFEWTLGATSRRK